MKSRSLIAILLSQIGIATSIGGYLIYRHDIWGWLIVLAVIATVYSSMRRTR